MLPPDIVLTRVRELGGEWELVPDGEVSVGSHSLVVPVRSPEGPAVLKLGYPDVDSEHEGLALQRLGGRGAVRLLRADPHRRALLLEQLLPQDLGDHWDVEACEVVAGLYAAIHVPAPPQLRRLSTLAAGWASRLTALPRSAPVPRRLVEQAAALTRDFARDPATDAAMIHTDLHYGNVLAAEREWWLVIDPKPLNGDPHHEVAPLLWNRWSELEGDVRGGVRRRFHATIDAAGFDEHRARDWVVVRAMVNALEQIEDDEPDTERLTQYVTLAKAVQD